MPTETPNESFIQAIITAFTEHPEALKTLLENKPINDALAAYLNAAAERLKPKQEWKEIYANRSKIVREMKRPDNVYFGRPEETTYRVVALMEVFYEERMRIAIVFGGITYAERNFFRDTGVSFSADTEFRKAEFFDDPSEAIAWGQLLFPEIEERFIRATAPVVEAAQPADHADA